jgi:serine O-acetyltransferase
MKRAMQLLEGDFFNNHVKLTIMAQQAFITTLHNREYQSPIIYDRSLAVDFIDGLFHFLFTPDKSEVASLDKIQRTLQNIRNTLSALLFDVLNEKEEAEAITENFFKNLPEIYRLLIKDANAIVSFDPAAVSIEEVFTAYPGFYATAVYRFAHQLNQNAVPILPRFLSERAHSKTGIDIHPGAEIGESFFIDHGTGIVIGQSTIIGDNVKLYQGVTLGALSTSKDKANKKRHPSIGNNVIIYAGATVLGGETAIGDNSIIGGNVWLTQSVGPDSVVYHQSSVFVKGRQPVPEPLNFVI